LLLLLPASLVVAGSARFTILTLVCRPMANHISYWRLFQLELDA